MMLRPATNQDRATRSALNGSTRIVCRAGWLVRSRCAFDYVRGVGTVQWVRCGRVARRRAHASRPSGQARLADSEGEVRPESPGRVLTLESRKDIASEEEGQSPGKSARIRIGRSDVAEGHETGVGAEQLITVADTEADGARRPVGPLQRRRKVLHRRGTVEPGAGSRADRVQAGAEKDGARAAVAVAVRVTDVTEHGGDVARIRIDAKDCGAAQAIVGLRADAEDHRTGGRGRTRCGEGWQLDEDAIIVGAEHPDRILQLPRESHLRGLATRRRARVISAGDRELGAGAAAVLHEQAYTEQAVGAERGHR